MDPIEPWVDREELLRLANELISPPRSSSPAAGEAGYGEEFEGFTGGGDESSEAPDPSAQPAPLPAQEEPSAEPGTAPPLPEDPPFEHQLRGVLANARKIAQRGGLLNATAAESPPETPAHPAPEAPPTTPAPPSPDLTQVSPVPSPPASDPLQARTPFVERLKAYGAWVRGGVEARAFFVIDREGGILIDEVHSPKLQQVARTLAQASRTANRQAGAAAVGHLHIKVSGDSILEVVPVETRYGPLILGIIVPNPLSPANAETVALGLRQVIDGNTTSEAP